MNPFPFAADVLIRVFFCVDQEWHRVLQDPSLWSTFDLSGCQKPEPALQLLHGSSVAAEALQKIVLEFAVGIEDRHLRELHRYSLEELNLNGCQK